MATVFVDQNVNPKEFGIKEAERRVRELFTTSAVTIVDISIVGYKPEEVTVSYKRDGEHMPQRMKEERHFITFKEA